MGGHHLAIYNFGLHVDDYDSPRVEGFRLREPLNFEAANRAEGFVGRSGYEGEPGPASRAEARSAAEEHAAAGAGRRIDRVEHRAMPADRRTCSPW